MSALVMGGLGIKTADAQIGIHVNLRFGTPVHAPAPVVVNEPVYDDYYYLPEVAAYYSVGENCYYYQDGDNWISAAYLPGRYRNFDWRTAKRYEIHANRPYMHDDVYRGKFGGNINRGDVYARGGFNNRADDRSRGQNQYDNRRDDNRGGYDRRDDRNQNNYNQTPNRNQGGYNQNPGRNQGGYNNGSQPSQGQGQQGGRGNGQQGGNSQPTNHNSGQDRGSNVNEHFAANKMGVVQERATMVRPVRN